MLSNASFDHSFRKDIAPDAIKQQIQDSLEDNKVEDLVVIDMAGRSSLADYMVIGTGRSSTHVSALTDHVERQLKKIKAPVFSVSGKSNGDWVLVDAGDVIVHLFRPEVREFYQLEKMWQQNFDELAEA
jgi:ribosome-associated protein